MGKIRLMFLAAFLAGVSFPSFSAYRVVIDKKCIEQVAENLAQQSVVELPHNIQLDSIRNVQKDIANKTTALATFRKARLYSMQNVHDFDSESIWYEYIGRNAIDIVTMIPGVTKTVLNSNMTGKARAVVELGKISNDTKNLVSDFVNLVTNATVLNPLKKGGVDDGEKRAKDGYNLMTRYDRLIVAIRIVGQLNTIKARLVAVQYHARYSTFKDLLWTVDSKGMAMLANGELHAKTLLSQWKGLSR